MWKQTEPVERTESVTSLLEPAGEEMTFMHSAEVLRPSLDADATVNGRLSFSRPTRLDGTLRGEVHSTALLVIGETGVVDGTVRAAKLLILGKVLGDVLDAGCVEIGPGGELHGHVQARAFVVQEGGHFDGDCSISPPPRATVHVLHPDRKADDEDQAPG
jgi:cytoskeletal protein CcmA (bactofilin family)